MPVFRLRLSGSPVDSSGVVVQLSLLVNDVGVAASPWVGKVAVGRSRGGSQL
jgi:hypothetical protein